MPCMNGKRLEDQLRKLLRDIKAQAEDECLILISSPFSEVSGLLEQLKRMNDQVIFAADYYNKTEYYAADVETLRKQLMTAIESKNVALIRGQNRQFVSCICSLEKVSRLYIQNLLYSVVKAVYDIAPGAAFEKVLISAEALFQENDLRTIVGEYERILEL